MQNMLNFLKFFENTYKSLAHGPHFGPMGHFNFQIHRLGRAWAKVIWPGPEWANPQKCLYQGPGQVGQGQAVARNHPYREANIYKSTRELLCLGQWLKFHQHQVNMQECIE